MLRSDDGVAIVIERGTSLLDALLTLLEQEYGVPRFSETNSVIVQAIAGVHIEVWQSCTKTWRESRDIEDGMDWWAPDGDGRRSITVAYYEGDAYLLGENAETAEKELG